MEVGYVKSLEEDEKGQKEESVGIGEMGPSNANGGLRGSPHLDRRRNEDALTEARSSTSSQDRAQTPLRPCGDKEMGGTTSTP